MYWYDSDNDDHGDIYQSIYEEWERQDEIEALLVALAIQGTDNILSQGSVLFVCLGQTRMVGIC